MTTYTHIADDGHEYTMRHPHIVAAIDEAKCEAAWRACNVTVFETEPMHSFPRAFIADPMGGVQSVERTVTKVIA